MSGKSRSRFDEPELPKPIQPRPPKGEKAKAGVLPRAIAAVAGGVFTFSSLVNLYSSLTDNNSQTEPFMALALLLPAAILLRYTFTGQIKNL